MSNKTIVVELTSALAIDGVICKAGEVVEVSELEAKNFLHRGKAKFFEPEDGTDEAAAEDDADDDLMKLTKDELNALAKEAGVETTDRMVKAEIIAALKAAKDKE